MLFEPCSPQFRRGFRRGLSPAPSLAPAVFPEQSGSPPAAGRAPRAMLPGLLHPGWGKFPGASPGMHRNPSEVVVILEIVPSRRL